MAAFNSITGRTKRPNCPLGTLALALIIAGIVTAVPGADAQTTPTNSRLDAAITGFTGDTNLLNGRIIPEAGVAEIAVASALQVNMYGRTATCSTPVQVHYSVTGPTYAAPSISPAMTTVIVGGGSGSTAQASWETIPLETTLQISVSRGAPAFADGLYQVTMQAVSQSGRQSSACDLGSTEATTGEYRLRNDFVPRTVVTAPQFVVAAKPNERIALPLTVENRGNGPVRVSLTLSTTPGDFQSVNAGPEVRLSKPQDPDGGQSSPLIIEVTTPDDWGYTNEAATVTAVVTTQYDGPGSTTSESTEVQFVVRTQGTYIPLGALPSVVTVPSILLLAFVLGVASSQTVVTFRQKRQNKRLANAGETPSKTPAHPVEFSRS